VNAIVPEDLKSYDTQLRVKSITNKDQRTVFEGVSLSTYISLTSPWASGHDASTTVSMAGRMYVVPLSLETARSIA